MKECERRENDEPLTIPPTLFSANKYNETLAWSLRNAMVLFGDLVFRQDNGLPQGVPAGSSFCNHYFHQLEDLYVHEHYSKIIQLKQQLKTATHAEHIWALLAQIETHRKIGSKYNNDVRYMDDTFSTVKESAADHTKYLEAMYHCNVTRLAIEHTATIAPDKYYKHGFPRATKCTLMDLDIRRCRNGDTYYKKYDKKDDFKDNLTTTISTFDTNTSNCPPGTLLGVYEDTTHAKDLRTTPSSSSN